MRGLLLSSFAVLVLSWSGSVVAQSGNIDRTVETTTIETFDGESTDVSLISYEYMKELFDGLSNHPRIPFKYPDDGCYARAHKMSLLLESKDIVTVKSFIIGDLEVRTPNHPAGVVNWWYHVAPALYVKDGLGGKIFMVFDPSIFDMPVSYDDWTGMQTKHQNGRIDEAYQTVRFVYTPRSGSSSEDLKDYLVSDLIDMESTLDLYKQMEQARREGVRNEDYLY